MSVYDWHDPWAWVAAKQRTDVQFPHPSVLGTVAPKRNPLDETAREELLVLAKRYRHGPTLAVMQRLGFSKLAAVPTLEQRAFVRQVRDILERWA